MGYGVTVATYICLIDKFIQIYYFWDMDYKEWMYLLIGIWGYSFLARILLWLDELEHFLKRCYMNCFCLNNRNRN